MRQVGRRMEQECRGDGKTETGDGDGEGGAFV